MLWEWGKLERFAVFVDTELTSVTQSLLEAEGPGSPSMELLQMDGFLWKYFFLFYTFSCG